MSRTIQAIRRLVEPHDVGGPTDRRLLERFAGQHDEAAFALLVRRHGPMVLGVCRRVLRHRHDAEDAFQAAFLVLARKASAVRWRDSVGGWLFQVAYRLALRMRAGARRHGTGPVPEIAVPDRYADQPHWELRALLDEELCRLPEKYRAVLLLCYYEGKTRAEAARHLECKEGTVKIRLERGRELLRVRLLRRGVGLSGLLASSLLVENAASAASVAAVATAARLFAMGKLPAASVASQSAGLAEGVLKTMKITRLKTAALLLLAVGCVSLVVGTSAHRAFADRTNSAPTRQQAVRAPQPPDRPLAEPAPEKDPEKPVRVLLFAGGATREYQFVRGLFVKEVDRKRAELSICLQGDAPGVQDVPPERLLKKFPTRFGDDKNEEAAERYGNLAAYDLVIAFDPDWTQLTEDQQGLLKKWVGVEGHGLILVAGEINTPQLGRPAAAKKLQAIVEILPVQVGDSRVDGVARDATVPHALSFPAPEPFLKLNEEGKDSLSGWSEFFFDKPRDDWLKTEDRPDRGFYSAYPIKSVKKDATIIATFRDPKGRIPADGDKLQNLPYLVVMPVGKGRTIYLGSGETWRLRQYRDSFHERLWTQLTRYAVSARPAR